MRKINLSAILACVFGLQIVVAVGATAILSFQSGRESVKEIAEQLRQEIATQTEQKLKSYLDPAFRLTELNVRDYINGEINPNIPFKGAKSLHNQTILFPDLSFVYCASEEDAFIGVGWNPDQKLWTLLLSSQSTNFIRTNYIFDASGQPVQIASDSARAYYPRTRPWYKGAVAKQGQTWSEIYLGFADFHPNITASQPVFDSQGKIIGVCATDVILNVQFNSYLQKQKIGKTGIAFLMERSGNLIASSTLDKITEGKEGATKILKAEQSSNIRIKKIGEFLASKASSIQNKISFETEINGQLELLTVFPFQDVRGIDWLLIISVPQSDFTEKIDQNNRNTIALCLLAIVVAVFVSILTSRWIARPLKKLVAAAENIKAGDLEQSIPSTQITEIDMLSSVFNQMSDQLNESFHTLEKRVIDRTQELSEANHKIAQLNDQLQEDNLRMRAELEITGRLQQAILPSPEELAAIPELEIAALMIPATEVGGDYFDVLYYHDRVVISIGDVTGHGLESGILAIMTQSITRTLAIAKEENIGRILDIINRTIFDNVQRMQSDKNLTFLLITYCSGKLVVTGQHEHLIIIRSNGYLECIDTIDLGFIIGLEQNITDFIAQEIIELDSGDGIVLYTDGITEAKNGKRQLYGLEKLCQVLQKHWHLTSEEIKQATIDDVQSHIGNHPIFDDITLLVIKRK